MPTSTPLATVATGAAATEGDNKTYTTNLRASIVELGDPQASFGYAQNLALSLTVAANALTIALKTRALADADTNNPVTVPFRNVTAGTGDFTALNVAAANSLVISSGSTMGASNGVPFRLWIVAFNDAGTFRLGAVNCLSGTSIMSLHDDDIQSSTAEGGAGAADSAQVIYTGTAVASKAMRVLGYAEWSSGLATAGTWSGAPTKVQTFGPGILLPGNVVQVARNQTGAVATGTTQIPYDDTIPQITEGDQYMTQAITPRSPCNVLAIDHLGAYSHSASFAQQTVALFQDATANALAAMACARDSSVGGAAACGLQHRMLAATSSSTTFRIRGGVHTAGTTTFNGLAAARIYAGVMASHLTVQEIMA